MLTSSKPRPTVTDKPMQPVADSQTYCSAEAQLLLCCARLGLGHGAVTEANALLAQAIDFAALIQLATLHRVLPLLYWSFQAQTLPQVPQSVHQHMLQCSRVNTLNNMMLAKKLTELLATLDTAGIQAIPFKGPILAQVAYQNLSLRQMGDLDLLVRPEDVERATALLEAQGYQRNVDVPWEIHLRSCDGRCDIDLHRDIVPQHLSCFPDSQVLWDNLSRISLVGQTVQTLTPEMLLFVLCLNGTKEKWCKFNRICDVAALVSNQPLDWQLIREQAKQWGCQRLVGIGLLLAHDLLSVPLPESVSQWVKSDTAISTITQQLQADLFKTVPTEPGEVERSLFHIRTREGLLAKLRSLRGLLQHSGWLSPTENDRQAMPLPSYLSPLYYLIRPFRIVRKYFI